MITVTTAKRADLPQIQALQAHYGKMLVGPEHINKRDIALVAIDSETGAVVGFAWGGLMAQNTVLYVDKVCADPGYSKRGVVNALYHEVLGRAQRLGVRSAFGVIRRDQYHERSAMNVLKMAGAADPYPYTYCYGDIAFITSELSQSEAS